VPSPWNVEKRCATTRTNDTSGQVRLDIEAVTRVFATGGKRPYKDGSGGSSPSTPQLNAHHVTLYFGGHYGTWTPGHDPDSRWIGTFASGFPRPDTAR
jgi:hypothetical protein